ncbi:MAG: hypothetical protein LUE29_09810 [Lachnospiraceae bacterium]|nr:hypothetical protein [Lachnospiraceae bacterium]
MTYPAIVYSLDNMPSRHANDGVYLLGDRYQVILIDKDPDNTTREKLALLPTSQFNRYYAQDNLNHYVFTLYY